MDCFLFSYTVREKRLNVKASLFLFSKKKHTNTVMKSRKGINAGLYHIIYAHAQILMSKNSNSPT